MVRSTLDVPFPPRCAAPAARRPGFTLIELLIVIGVIVILIGIAFSVGVKVTGTGKKAATDGVLKAVDVVLTEYAQSEGRNPRGFYWDKTNGRLFPGVDGRFLDRPASLADKFDQVKDPAQPSLGPVLAEIAGSPGAAADMLKGVDPKYIARRTSKAYGWVTNVQGPATGGIQQFSVEMVEVLDGWGNPLRCVLPGMGGGYGEYFKPNAASATVRGPLTVKTPPKFSTNPNSPSSANFTRSFRPYDPATVQAANPVGDADEGTPLSARPYVYSAGADGNPGGRVDNVYLTRPHFPSETQGMDE
jgi:prepilin-type N-terminal cleavage/methylation domain-containing protein